ncbi:uncharacterized protein LAJ45_08624 [Morchella importuna]|uniref:uncharacterized protein n=1 Tax=Morchella importuna TaxID=1174673 RepID=UPI001E8E9AAE|nr:uncharacterized protein LAJ45_08624 [Morchella importuna]KAH8147467.1 hypothetical protein LAJ45_08624 [Morchella importuna]
MNSSKKVTKNRETRAARAAKRAQIKNQQKSQTASTIMTSSSRNTKNDPPLLHNKAFMAVVRMTKFHTDAGAHLYHMVFDNGKAHLAKVPELLDLITLDALHWYEHTLFKTTAKWRVDTTETIPERLRLQIDSERVFPKFIVPKACRKRACFICRNQNGYLNYNNGESEVWKQKSQEKERKRRELEEKKRQQRLEAQMDAENDG